ncbi:hypothetical protein F4815DRAFT_443016 [Daldinia loculata]|nr:hypothetical protein F4815DRAFT_443016 [Daldinia loculata]
MDYDLIGRLLLSLPAADAENARMAALADRISTYFTRNENLIYRGVVGIGRHGGAILFLDKRRHPFRKIVVKYSLSDEADADLRNEAQFLEMLRGAEHIGQMIPLAEATLNVSGTGKRPTLALDFIPVDESYIENVPEGGWPYDLVDKQTGEGRRMGTEAPPFFTRSKYIDVELRDLVARCMAIDIEDTPSLEQLVEEAERGVAKRPEDIVYEDTGVDPRQTEEDVPIRTLVQRFILDAGTIEEEAATLNRRTVNHHLGTTLLGINATTRPGPAQRRRFQQSNVEPDMVVDNDID